MPDNSLIPDYPVTTAQVPRQNLSKADIAAPMRDMADATDKSARVNFDFSGARLSTLA